MLFRSMTEVILCLSAVYSGRPLPPRKKNPRSSKSDEKEERKKTVESTKKETTADVRIGKFRTDAQGYRENIYDPTKATEGKKLATNSVAARRKRAAASSAAASNPGASKHSTIATLAPNAGVTPSQDPLTFSSIQGSKEDSNSNIAFSSFGDLNREFVS